MKIVTKNDCPQCTWLKQQLKNRDIEATELSLDDPETRNCASAHMAFHNIQTTPMVIDDSGKGWVGMAWAQAQGFINDE